MSSRRLHIGLDLEAARAASEKMKKLDEDDTVAIRESRSARIRRLEQLDLRTDAFKRAATKYRRLDNGDHPDIRIRRRFLRLSTARPRRESSPLLKTVKGDVDTRPVLTSLTHRPSNALQVYLSLLYIAHLEFEPGDRWKNERANNGVDGWSELCGLLALDVSNRELNLRMTRALTKLAEHDLVRVGARRSEHRFDRFTLFCEDQSRKRYFVPSEETGAVVLPAGFFMAGWHLVLTNEEMATLLAVAEQTQRPRNRKDADEAGVALPQLTRWQWYGLAPEAFAGRHELQEFGLIDMFDPMDRTNGKLPEKQRQKDLLRAPRITLKLDEVDFSRPAIEVVKAKLRKPVAHRWEDRAIALQLIDNNRQWRERLPMADGA